MMRLLILPGLDGIGARLAEFASMLPPSSRVRVIGYPPDEPLGYAELEARVRAEIPAGERFVLLAESFAGPLAIRLAGDAPPGLAGLILCGTFVKNPFPWLRPIRALAVRLPLRSLPRWLRAPLMWGSVDPRRATPQPMRSMARVAPAVIRRRIGEILSVDESEKLSRVALPVLIIAARRDRIVPRGAARALRNALPSAQWVQIDGPHLLLQAKPRECAAAVLQFLERWP